jgi:acyl-CoA dehydrogenase
MTWSFETDPEFEEQLQWIRRFVREECEPLDLLWPEYHLAPPPDWLRAVIDPLKQEVRARGLWATYLGPELGGKGFGQVKLALINEQLGPSPWAQTIFGVNAPDTGNAEILARYGTEEQKRRYLQPLLDGEIFSTFSMTEPQAGADPAEFTTRAVRDGEGWVIDGEKFFSSNARDAEFVIVMAVTDPAVLVYEGTSMFLIPSDTAGLRILRDTTVYGELPGVGLSHPHLRYDGVRVPSTALLGPEGKGFEVAQARLGGGRIHHAMRAVGVAQRAFEMMCERASSRHTKGSLLADKQMVQEAIADSYLQIEQFRLFVLQAAWQVDRSGARSARRAVSASKVLAARVLRDVVGRALHLHGALGVSDEMPFGRMWIDAAIMGIHDGPTEVHLQVIARTLLREQVAAEGLWPSGWLPARVDAARRKHADALTGQDSERESVGAGHAK